MTPVYLPPHRRRRVSVLALLVEAAVIAAGFYTLGFALIVLGALIAS